MFPEQTVCPMNLCLHVLTVFPPSFVFSIDPLAVCESHDELLRQWVTEALYSKSAGTGTKLYDELLGVFRRLKLQVCKKEDSTYSKQLSDLIQALSRCIASLHERKHEVLLQELLDLSVWEAPEPVRRALLEFVTHSVVANSGLVQSCLHTLVYSLLPPPGPVVPDPNSGEEWKATPEQEEIQDAVVATTVRVLELVPTASARILPLLSSNLPHRLRDRTAQCLYLRGLFALAESRSGAGLREATLAAVIDHLITIDVEIRWEDIVDIPSEDAKEEIAGMMPKDDEPDIFELEGMTETELALHDGGSHQQYKPTENLPGGGWEGAEQCHLDENNRSGGNRNGWTHNDNDKGNDTKPPPVDETADKLDSMMELTLQHLSRRMMAGQLLLVWETLLASFDRTVLHTHRSKFTQFLMFYLLRHAPDSCLQSFLHFLLSKLMDKMQPSVTRSACAAYIASFLARAAFVPEPIVVESLLRLADWCLKYVREEDRRGGLPPIPSSSSMSGFGPQDARERHTPFFAAFQALLYVLCYHMEPLLASAAVNSNKLANGDEVQHSDVEPAGDFGGTKKGNDGHSDSVIGCAHSMQRILSEMLPTLLSHQLNPLSSCTRSVVVEFGRQASMLGCTRVIESLKAWEFRRRALAIQRHNARPLEVFFPFDPYLLRRSAKLLDLQTSYVKWRRGHPSGATRSGLDVQKCDIFDDDDMSDDIRDIAGGSSEDSSGLDDSSDEDEVIKDSSIDGGSGLDEDDASSDSDIDDMKRTRFGSMPDSSLSSGGRRYALRGIPKALKASLKAHGSSGGSPTLGVSIPGAVGSASTDAGSPWGISPMNGYYGNSFAPMSFENRSLR